MSGYADGDRSGNKGSQTVRHIHVTQELRNGRLVTLEHTVFERGMAEPNDMNTIFDRTGWLAWLAREAAGEFRKAA